MTSIRDFLKKINTNPSCMTRVNWKEETEDFRYRRLRAIILGIKDEEACRLAREYIIYAWCYATHEPTEEIVEILDQCFVERNEKFLERLHKQELDNRARSLRNNALIDNKTTRCAECKRLQEENEYLKKELEKNENGTLKSNKQAWIDGIRSVVEQLIVYGENFPSNQNDKAEVIKEALLAKSFNGHIPSEALRPEWKARLNNLGRKEIGVSFQGESMFKIIGNKEVNIGGK